MSCAKNSSISLIEIWEAVLKSGDKVTTSLVQNTHRELVHPNGMLAPVNGSLTLPAPLLDFNAPANLVQV
jgi:hypothetical protein